MSNCPIFPIIFKKFVIKMGVPPLKTYKIHLIRHGLTRANLEGLYCGVTDLPLCPEGTAELTHLAATYSYPFVDVVYCSPLLRARQTAEILFPGCALELVDSLREISFGIYEGRALAELKNDDAFQKWVSFGSSHVPPGAEPHDVFARRCVEGFVGLVEDMMRRGLPSAAVVTHAGVIAQILAALAYPKKSVYDWQSIPGCGYTAVADPSLFLRQPVVEIVDYVPEDLDIGL